MMQVVLAKAVKVYELYKPYGLVNALGTCWRSGFMADRLVDLLTYEGLKAKRKSVVISSQGHICVEVTAGSKVVTVDPSVEQFGIRTGVLCVDGPHPDTEV